MYIVPEKEKVLILGGTGFIGKNLVNYFTKKDMLEYNVKVVSRQSGVNILNYEEISKCVSDFKPHYIFNLASHGGSLHYVKEFAADVVSDNIQMALNIYRSVKENAPNCRIITPFSNCSYPGSSNIQVEEKWLDGDVHPSIFSFGNSKRSIYYLSKCYYEQYGIKSINLLFANTYGPGDSCDPNHTHALNGMIIRMLQAQRNGDKEFVVWGTGSPVREWTYVDDFISVLVNAMEINHLEYPVNVGQEMGYSIAESARMIQKALKFEGEILFDTTKMDGDPIKIMSNKKFKNLFPGFEFYDHKKGIQETVKYYKNTLL